jgi:tetraacyldisaccharide 4'-kinase
VSRIERHWYRPCFWMTALLVPLEGLFALLSALRRMAYRYGWIRTQRLAVPVVVIGNINVGGVGKTPLTVALLESLQQRGVRVGVISRGYGGTHRVAVEVTALSTAAQVGDEPLLLAATGAPVVVGRDRIAAGHLLLQSHPNLDLILADDGLQHYRLARDLEIVVLDGRRGLGNGHLLPNGPLRESVARLAHVDALVVNGSGSVLPLPVAVPCFSMQLEPGALYAVGQPTITRQPQEFAGQRVVALAGIGHPERFFATVRAEGILVQQELAFPDHHAFCQQDVPADADAVLVTSKDAVKMLHINHAKLWVLPVRARLSPDLADWILARLKAIHGH